MPSIHRGQTDIYHEELGNGYPMLLIAPGGLNSSISRWESATINPLEAFTDDFRLVAMDQRNAGRSRAPFPTARPWEAYLEDQIAVMDALGHERFHLFGCCIGGSFALKLAHAHPDRVSCVVLEQPMGLVPKNHAGWRDRCHDWVPSVVADRDDLDEPDGHRFIDRMWQMDFVASLTRAEVSSLRVPTCVLPGVDDIHPREVGYEIARLVPGASLVSPWKDSPEHAKRATAEVREFLSAHTP